jgi:hypothetical protein
MKKASLARLAFLVSIATNRQALGYNIGIRIRSVR